MKLFTIGDSVSQGFMSLAAARTDYSYSSLIAGKLGLTPKIDYRYPDWPAEGLPLNIEAVLRRLNRQYGSDIGGFEWLTVLQTINDVIDKTEDYYERGEGAAEQPYPGGVKHFDNVAVSGFTVADAWLVTPELCKRELQFGAGPRPSDGFLTGPDKVTYRTALKVLNPSLKEEFDRFSQIEWLRRHATGEGVENLVLWLGSNNALGSVVSLRVRQTPPDPNPLPHQLEYLERQRQGWNLWHPDHFRAEYRELLERVDGIMRQNTAEGWRVFIGTVPLVTIAPLAKGVGETTAIEGKGVYYKYYTYFPFEEPYAHQTGMRLTMQDAVHIDDCIREYNRTIKECVRELNGRHGGVERYHVVDIEHALNRLAYKRNGGQPVYEFPPYFDFVYPKVNTKYYHVDPDGQFVQGGLFSLDGVHPSVIAHGLLAYEFLKVMKRAGVVGNANLDWNTIFANDLLYMRPITIMQELYGKDDLAKHVVGLIRLLEAARGVLR